MDDFFGQPPAGAGGDPAPPPAWPAPPGAGGLPGAAPSDDWAAPAHGPMPAPSRRRRRVLVRVGATAVVVAGAAVGLVLTIGGSAVPGAGIAPATFVRSAAQATLQQGTAELDLQGQFSSDGISVGMSGSGAVDFAANRSDLTLGFGSGAQSFHEEVITVPGDAYLNFSEAGQGVSTVVPGKDWVEIPVAVSATSGLGMSTPDPVQQLQTLAQAGNTVRSLGTATLNGETVARYSVTLSEQNVQQSVQRFVATSGLSAAAAQQLEQEAASFSPPTVELWIGSGSILRREVLDLSVNSGATSVSGTLTMDFVHYGAPVTVTPPAADDVVGFAPFLNTAFAAGKTTT